MDPLHEGALEAVSEWASSGAGVVDPLSAAGPDLSIETVAPANGIDADLGWDRIFR